MWHLFTYSRCFITNVGERSFLENDNEISHVKNLHNLESNESLGITLDKQKIDIFIVKLLHIEVISFELFIYYHYKTLVTMTNVYSSLH